MCTPSMNVKLSHWPQKLLKIMTVFLKLIFQQDFPMQLFLLTACMQLLMLMTVFLISVPSYVHVACMVGLCNNLFVDAGVSLELRWCYSRLKM